MLVNIQIHHMQGNSWSSLEKRILTKRNDVARNAEPAEVELRIGEVFPTIRQANGNRCGIRRGEANDTNAREGVESGRGTEVDETKQDLDNHTQHHGVEWQV